MTQSLSVLQLRLQLLWGSWLVFLISYLKVPLRSLLFFILFLKSRKATIPKVTFPRLYNNMKNSPGESLWNVLCARWSQTSSASPNAVKTDVWYLCLSGTSLKSYMVGLSLLCSESFKKYFESQPWELQIIFQRYVQLCKLQWVYRRSLILCNLEMKELSRTPMLIAASMKTSWILKLWQ